MKIAVTGASGFVGRAVVAELVRAGVEVTAVLRPGTTLPADAGPVNIAHLDLADPPAAAFARLGRPDTLVHLAWGGLPNYSSMHHLDAELPMHQRFLAGLCRAGLGALVVAGTCFEYGMQHGPLHEALAPAPANPYALAKDSLRRQLECLRAEVPFRFTWARLFYLHGEGQAATSLYPLLRRAVQRGDAEFPMSGGEQLRDYLAIGDAARTLARLALARADAGVLNVCSGEPISVRRLVEGWIEANGWAIRPALGHHPYAAHEPMAFWGDTAKLRHCLEAA